MIYYTCAVVYAAPCIHVAVPCGQWVITLLGIAGYANKILKRTEAQRDDEGAWRIVEHRAACRQIT